MATSIIEQIAQKIKARLALITTANGYENTTSGVIRPKRIEDSPANDYQIIVTQGTCVPTVVYPGNPATQEWEATFQIAGILRPSESSTVAADTFRNQFWGDVIKAVGTPTTGDWAQWDGLANNTKLGDVEPYAASDAESCGFMLSLLVTFRTDENNPFNVRA